MLYLKRFETGGCVDVAEDFTLPDYQPEIRRVVSVKASASTDGKYLSGDEVEVDGSVTYTVLYISGSGELAQASQTSSYTGRIPVKCEDDRFSPGDVVLTCSADSVSCRVTAPRKFTLSSRVKLGVASQRGADTAVRAAEHMSGMLRKRNEVHATACMTEVRKNAEVSGDIKEREGIRVIMAHGEVALSDVRVNQSRNEAVIKGDAYVNILALTPDGEHVTVRGRAPVEEAVPIPDLPVNTTVCATAFGNVVLIELEVGEDGGISWNMEYDIDCEMMKCSEAEVTCDAYLTGSDDKVTSADFDSYMPAVAQNGRLTATASLKLKSPMSYIYSWGSGYADRCEISRGRASVSGGVKLNVITAGEGEVAAEEVTIPLKYECEALAGAEDSDGGNLCKKAQVNVSDITVRLDGDVMNITAELSIAVIAVGWEKVSAVMSVAPSGQPDNSPAGANNIIRVYVPDRDETAWDVEKKFRLGRECRLEGEKYII